jgi:hypothetical protein
MIQFRRMTTDVEKLALLPATSDLFCGAVDRETSKRLHVTKPHVQQAMTQPVNLLTLRLVM